MPKSSSTATATKPAKLSPSAIQALLKQAIELHQHGFLAQAEQLYNSILAAQPQQVDALHLLGVLSVQTQRPDQGVALIRRAVEINKFLPALHSNLGNALMAVGQLEEAATSYARAIHLKPDFAEAHCNRGNALRDLGRHEAALASYDKAISLNPRLADAHGNRGNALRDLNRLEEALASHDQALRLNPQHPDLLMNRGTVLAALQRFDEALECYERAITLAPGLAVAHRNQGNALLEHDRPDQARLSYERALQLNPADADARRSLGVVHQELGELSEAVACFRAALAARPDHAQSHSSLLFALSFDPHCTSEQYLDQARACSDALLRHAQPFTDWPAARAGGPALKVGFVSEDLMNHPVGFFLETVLGHLRGQGLTLVAYTSQRQEDEVTARLKPLFDGWRNMAGQSDAAIAHQIRNDGIQILVDLGGHTPGNRLPIFAWKPAPVQIAWLGYFASTGLATMDAIVADETGVPAGEEGQFTERVWRLPDTRLCFTPPTALEDLPPSPLPALRLGHLTLGSFQHLSKLNENTLAAWGRIMQALPRARLRIQNKQMASEHARHLLLARLARAGIAAERVTLIGPASRRDYLAAHEEIDFLLDTAPFPGGTTTCEALWMGVPTLTQAGHTLLSRQGAGMMACVGLHDWIASDADDMVARAKAIAGNLDALAACRSSLRQRLADSPLLDATRFAGHLAQVFKRLWAEQS